MNRGSETCGTVSCSNKKLAKILEKEERIGQRKCTGGEFSKVNESYQPTDWWNLEASN